MLVRGVCKAVELAVDVTSLHMFVHILNCTYAHLCVCACVTGSFGFDSAVAAAQKAIKSAKVLFSSFPPVSSSFFDR